MPSPQDSEHRMLRSVAAKQQQMLRARRQRGNHWSAISIIGVVGWSVVVPMLLGIALGIWIDRHWPGRFSWTLTLLVAGLVIGCVTAWVRLRETR